LGRLAGGVATSLLFSVFESWAVSELNKRWKVSTLIQEHFFSTMWFVNFIVAIAAGLFSQALVSAAPEYWPNQHPTLGDGKWYLLGKTLPFDAAAMGLVLGWGIIWTQWKENFGTVDTGSESDAANRREWLTSWPLWACGIIVACFEGAMFIFVFNWTPAMTPAGHTPPHGLVFAMFMMCAMCGSCAVTLVQESVNIRKLALPMLLLAAGCLAACTTALSLPTATMLPVLLWAFNLFECCVGFYFPVISVVKSEVVPEEIRALAYNIYRVPLNALVVVVLLVDIPLRTSFFITVAMLLLASACMLSLDLRPKAAGRKGVEDYGSTKQEA